MSISSYLKSLADNIRSVKGTTGNILGKDIPSEISKLAYISDDVTGKIPTVGAGKPSLSIKDKIITAKVTQEKGYTEGGTRYATLDLAENSYSVIPATTYTPSTTNQVIPANTLVTGEQTILGDPNLLGKNILRCDENGNLISIFGVPGELDIIRPIVRDPFDNGNYGITVANIAKSYHTARVDGTGKFVYGNSNGIYSGNKITNDNGECYIDCSMFIGNVLRGIDYQHSPYASCSGRANCTFATEGYPRNLVAVLAENSSYPTADVMLDRQTDPTFFDLGNNGKYSIRYAAQIAEYYYGLGCTLYEFTSSPTVMPSGLRPGDVLFWAYPSASANQKARFKAISHVAIVAENGTHMYHVTSADSKVCVYSKIADHLSSMKMIARPFYNIKGDTGGGNPGGGNNPSDIGVDLIADTYSSFSGSNAYTDNGLTFTKVASGGFTLSGTPTASTTFYVRTKNAPITLQPGTYELDGCPEHTKAPASNTTSTTWGVAIRTTAGENINDVNGNRIFERGAKQTFIITETTDVYVYFYMSKLLTVDKEYIIKPTLKRISGSTTGGTTPSTGIEEYNNCINEQGTIDGHTYVYKLNKCKVTAYGGDSGSACSIPLNHFRTCGSFNLPFGTKVYIPALKGRKITDGNGKSTTSDGIFTVNDTGVGGTDFDIYVSTKSDSDAEKVFANTLRETAYILSYGSGKGTAWSYTKSFSWASSHGGLSPYKVAFKDYIKYGGTLINFTKFQSDDKNIRSSKYWATLTS